MSACADLETLKAERDMLALEAQRLKEAAQPETAAEEIMKSIIAKPDPMLQNRESDWVQAIHGHVCC
jgi:hypothetical protein